MSFLRRRKSNIKATDTKITITGTKEQLRVIANRVLPDEIARQYDTPFPVNFAQPFPLSGETPPGSGLAFKFSPYMQFYTKVYGVMPNSDFTKYRIIYRTQPDVKARVDKRVNLATGKGFTIKCDDPEGNEAAEWLNDWAKKIGLQHMFQSAGSDMIVYGTGDQELVWGLPSDTIQPYAPRDVSPINPGESSEETPVSGPLRAQINPKATDESESTIQGPQRIWVEETAICPKCHEHTLRGIRYTDNYTFYGDVASLQCFICENPECKSVPTNPESMPYCSDVTADAWMKHVDQVTHARYDGQDIALIQPEPPKEGSMITYIKDLDPLYIRPRADAYGNIFGYYQWINYPPVLLGPSAVIHYRWNIKSWGYETIYGTSDLMPIIRYYDMRVQFENDMVVWEHTYPKPTVHLMAGTPEHPYTDPQMKQVAVAWKKRQPGSDMLTKGDITSEVIETTVGGTTGGMLVEWLNYLNMQIHVPLGIPDELMGSQSSPQGGGGSNRSTMSVTMEDVIVQAELLQGVLTEPWEKNLFAMLLKAQGFPDNICQLHYIFIWKPIFEEDPNTKSARLKDFRTVGILSINACLAQIPDQKPIIKGDPRYKPEYDLPEYPIPAPAKSPDQIQAEADAKSSMFAPDSSTMPQGLDSGAGVKANNQVVRRLLASASRILDS